MQLFKIMNKTKVFKINLKNYQDRSMRKVLRKISSSKFLTVDSHSRAINKRKGALDSKVKRVVKTLNGCINNYKTIRLIVHI